MPERVQPIPVVLAPRAVADLRAILRRSYDRFGERAAERYSALIRQSLRDIEANPERFGSASRPDLLGSGARTYHISFSRRRAGSPGVKEPRHFLLYRRKRDPKDGQDVVEIARILHDSTDLARHLPPDYRREN